MKKAIIAIALTLMLASCTSNTTPSASPSATPTPTPTAANTTTGAEVRTGYAIVTTAARSKDAAEKGGVAQCDTDFIAVIIDSDGVIENCVIDGVQTAITFSTTGEITSDIEKEFLTKNELGTAYGMAGASGIGKEWNEQAAAFAEYVRGKTIDEVRGIAITESGAPIDEELSSSVTISVKNYIDAIAKAVDEAHNIGTKSGDKLGIAAITTASASKSAGEGDGLAQPHSTYAIVTTDSDNRISGCIIDGTQCNVTFDTAGKITSDTSVSIRTKNEMGEAYGMKKASPIGKEWNEQAQAYAEYVRGKTIDEVKGIAVTERGAPADTELSTSVTISIGAFNACIEKAINAAR